MVDTIMSDDEALEAACTLVLMQYPIHPLMRQSVVEAMEREHRVSSSASSEPVPDWLDEFIRGNNGEEPRKIIEKGLTATDVNSNNTRLSMPFSQILDFGFLTTKEERIVQKNAKKKPNKGLDAKLLCYFESHHGSYVREFNVNFRIWEMRSGPLYNLVTGWNQVVTDCSLKKDDVICVWSFHCNDKLYFALVLRPPSPISDSGDVGQT